jgi:hypothetical protein
MRSNLLSSCCHSFTISRSITAENTTLFEIDQELEATFDAATQEQEETGAMSDDTQQHCLDLFAELGKKVDRIARSVRATELKLGSQGRGGTLGCTAEECRKPRRAGQEHAGVPSCMHVV